MRANTRLITAPGWTEAPDASGRDGNNRVVRPKSAGATVSVVAPVVLEHDPEKWIPVFRKDHAPTKKLDHDPILFDRIMV
jgi:hypothetical protein